MKCASQGLGTGMYTRDTYTSTHHTHTHINRHTYIHATPVGISSCRYIKGYAAMVLSNGT